MTKRALGWTTTGGTAPDPVRLAFGMVAAQVFGEQIGPELRASLARALATAW